MNQSQYWKGVQDTMIRKSVCLHIISIMICSIVISSCDLLRNDEEPDMPPVEPVNLTAVAGDRQVVLNWINIIEPDLAFYQIYQSTDGINFTVRDEDYVINQATISLLDNGTTYYFYVTAVDKAENESPPSNVVTATPSSAAYETSQGWARFEADEFTAAKSNFEEAILMDNAYADAYCGLGWSKAMLNDLADAKIDFLLAINTGLSSMDAHAGIAGVYRDLSDLDSAIQSASTVLQNTPSYQFSHRLSIDYKDMHLIMAQCYYRKGESHFIYAQAQVNILDPSNNLNPSDPLTWIVSGVTYDSYAEALLKMIEKLETTIGG